MDVQYAKKLHQMVWDTRARLGDKWPTPDTKRSLAYAATESGEAIDADLRESRPFDARNNTKHMSREHELAQCAMMLLTAVGPEFDEAIAEMDSDVWSLSSIHLDVAAALNACENGDATWIYSAAYALSSIDTYCVGVDRYLQEVLEETEAKHGAKATE